VSITEALVRVDVWRYGGRTAYAFTCPSFFTPPLKQGVILGEGLQFGHDALEEARAHGTVVAELESFSEDDTLL
jgi:hypothetical protein